MLKNMRNKIMLNGSIKELVAEIQTCCQIDLLQESDLDELLTKEKLVLIRSARQELLEKFLNVMAERNYKGVLNIIGRAEDRAYIKRYAQLHLRLYEAPTEQRYSVENTRTYLEGMKAEGICFLYQSAVSNDYVNLLEILEQANCSCYAISNQLHVSKIKNLEKNLASRRLYKALCNWFYLN